MKTIIAEGTTFRYVPAATKIEAAGIDFKLPNSTVERLLDGADTRLALFDNLLPPHQMLPYWLVWQDEKDLHALDSKVNDGLTTDEDFVSAFRAVPQRTRCFKCGEAFQTLVIDSGDPYPGAPNLHRQKIAKAKILCCPRCGAALRQIVVKILDKWK